jgi:hypothetical protein
MNAPILAMELQSLITKLEKERASLDKVIVALTELQFSLSTLPVLMKKRRGRRFMPTKERLIVAERMKAYWTAQREARTSG